MRTCIFHPVLSSSILERDPELALEEALSLVGALDVDIVHSDRVNISKVLSGQFFGSGKAKEIGELLHSLEADLVVVNGTLSPIQQRNLERLWKTKILDRTGLILEIFGARARTREGVLQVDLAHLTYQRSRLVRSWTHLERQRGGGGFMGGPGETQIESDRRAIDNAIVRLKRQLEKVVKTRALHRSSRKKIPYPIVALVGYTNAGKSTIFNSLTGAGVFAKDQLFATLDPTMRAVQLPNGRDIILSDTVGFISDLPTQLIAAFRATLEEVLDADLIVHVRDISHPETEFQAENVTSVLKLLGLPEADIDGCINVWNKSDKLGPEPKETIETIATRTPDTILTSAKSNEGLDTFLSMVETKLAGTTMIEDCTLNPAQGRERAWLYSHNVVLSEETVEGQNILTVQWREDQKNRFLALQND